MCGRFALSLGADELIEEVRAHYAPDVTGWRDVQRNDAPAPSTSSSPSKGKHAKDSLEFQHGYRVGNYNVAPQTNVPVLYRQEISEGSLRDPVLQSMKWGLIPSWTKQKPETTSALKTINARDDTIMNGGMWNSQRGRRRAVVFCEGFYEWLKKGSDRLPHFTKFKDRKLMCFAALWDTVQYEGEDEPLYTFTIITTDSNVQLSFLHDRMPVCLSTKEEVATWLDTSTNEFTKEHAALLRPYAGELDCYAVPKEVGSVKNNSPDFVKPVAERKGNIASFFAKQAEKSPKKGSSQPASKASPSPKRKREAVDEKPDLTERKKVKKDEDAKGSLQDGETVVLPDSIDSEDNAPKPKSLIDGID